MLSCVGDEDGITRNAYATLLVNGGGVTETVDGGASGGGFISIWLLSLAGGLLAFRLRKTAARQ
jgi:hypothetical protein